MKMYPRFISALVSLLCLVHYSRGQEDMKLEDIEHGSSRENCLARDGRDGMPGRPGLQGSIGQPGRDGRDCMNTLSMDRLFDLEKRLGQLGQKCQLMEMERRKMNENIEAYRVQSQNILTFLAAKKFIDPDLIEILRLHLPAETPSTKVKFVSKPFESEENPTTGSPATAAPMSGIPRTEVPRTKVPRTEVPRTEVPRTEVPRTEVPRTEVPRTEVPRTEVPRTEVPRTEVPRTEVPGTEVPRTEIPRTEVPRTEIPRTEVPRTEVPRTEVPRTEVPRTEVPRTEVPRTEVPTTEVPRTEVPTTSIPTGHVIQNGTGKTAPELKTNNSTTGQVKKPRQFYTIVIKSQIQIKPAVGTPPESVSKPTVSDTDNDDDDTEKSTKNNCQKRFHVHQKVMTRGAVDMEVFEAANITFLAVANFHIISTSNGYNAKSFVYKMNPESDEFELFQELLTVGCRAMVAFTSRGESYLVAANHYDGTTFNLHSVIYKWNGMGFENFRKVPTSGASAAQFFTMAGESYLMFANYRNDTTVSVSSVIYKWRPGGNLELFQNLQTHGAVDCQFYESQYGAFLVFANYYTPQTTYNVESTVYKWNGTRFVFLQNILTSAATSVDMFEEKASLFLAIASNRKEDSWHSHSTIYRWNGQSFQSFQQITTTAAVKVNHFFDPQGALYLTIANYFDESTDFETHSMVYKFNGRRFMKFQGILTTGAYDLQPFTYKGVPYLASAFRYNGVNNNIDSKIYKMTTSCQTDDDILP